MEIVCWSSPTTKPEPKCRFLNRKEEDNNKLCNIFELVTKC